MTKRARFWMRLMDAQADADITFADLCTVYTEEQTKP